MMLVCQSNWGMRYGDLADRRFLDIIHVVDGQMAFKNSFYAVEHKTEETRKVKYPRKFYNNAAVKMAMILYMRNHPEKSWYDYLFTSESNNKTYIPDEYSGYTIQKGMSHTACENVIKDTLEQYCNVGLANGKLNKDMNGLKINTHSLRKMWGNKFKVVGSKLQAEGKINVSSDILLLAQNAFGHSNFSITQRYIEDVETVTESIVNEMNLGGSVLEKYIE